MCRKCPWEKALPLLEKLVLMDAAKPYQSWLKSELVKIYQSQHITNSVLAQAQKIEQGLGIKKRGDYDVQPSGRSDGRARSRFF